MAVTWDNFERYRQKGLDARRAGQWDSARIYLLEAARAMVALSKEAQGEELREGRRQMAAKLLELARDCEQAKQENRRAPGARGGGVSGGKGGSSPQREKSSDGEDGKDASDWIVKEKSAFRFAD